MAEGERADFERRAEAVPEQGDDHRDAADGDARSGADEDERRFGFEGERRGVVLEQHRVPVRRVRVDRRAERAEPEVLGVVVHVDAQP